MTGSLGLGMPRPRPLPHVIDVKFLAAAGVKRVNSGLEVGAERSNFFGVLEQLTRAAAPPSARDGNSQTARFMNGIPGTARLKSTIREATIVENMTL